MDITIYVILKYSKGPESEKTEVGCQSDRGSSITTGGGFSHYSNQHYWQEPHINNYLKNIDGTSFQPLYPSFDSSKRAYPDISALANKYIVVANKEFYVGILIYYHATY